jgi:hypothetical protein
LYVARIGELTVFIAKDNDVILENNEQITDLFTVTFLDVSALIAEDSGVAPQ